MNNQDDEAINSQETEKSGSEQKAQTPSESRPETFQNETYSKQKPQRPNSEALPESPPRSTQMDKESNTKEPGKPSVVTIKLFGFPISFQVKDLIKVVVILLPGVIFGAIIIIALIFWAYDIPPIQFILEPVIKTAVAETLAAQHSSQLTATALAPSQTPSSTPTPTATATATPIVTATPTPTNTHTPTFTPTPFADLDIVEVPWSNKCGGTITYVPEGFKLWFLIEQNNTFHPQTGGPLTVDPSTGEFEGICLIGTGVDQNSGEEFTVYTVLVDPQGSQIFADYLVTVDQKGYSGFTQDNLPHSCIFIGSMKVIRKKG